MIFRAIFWIGLVSLLIPHEPDLGLGHPGTSTPHLTPASIGSVANGLSRTDPGCSSACAGGLLSVFHLNNDKLTAGLADIKAQIEQDRRDRAHRAKTI